MPPALLTDRGAGSVRAEVVGTHSLSLEGGDHLSVVVECRVYRASVLEGI